ncbi:MAG: tRNA-(ms[2]io[6]A)-hydroxylase [Acidobacteriota bacterium]
MLRLRHDTPPEWSALALDRLDEFLQDHAANERKVSQSALTLVTQHPRKTELAEALIAVAQEELDHFRQVHEHLLRRGSTLAQDLPDPYMTKLRAGLRKGEVDEFLLDRLVLFGIIEARGCERFRMISEALPEEDPLQPFYVDLTRSEARHHALYIDLARRYFPKDAVDARLDELLDFEAEVMAALPLRPALH